MEFGVFEGGTINFIAGLNPTKKIYGFDSFKGLPEEWQMGASKELISKVGTFTKLGNLPKILDNVRLVVGWFNETLPKLKLKGKKIAFMHIDCDLYSSTKTIFDELS